VAMASIGYTKDIAVLGYAYLNLTGSRPSQL
jgi:hypothetical protein